ncbi:MAG: DUF11 domain-containing protein, partial [Verrucomicrobiae bacterium]|nr:DUF11 domain-containing protein [Verrucomicrobiae bacterium]
MPKKPRTQSALQFEALEPRVLFDAAPEVTVSTSENLTVAEDQFVNDDIRFEIEFDNTGDATGYAPYVDFVAPSELKIKGVTVYGAAAENPGGASVDPIGRIAADGQVVDITTGVPVDHPMFATSIGAPSSDYFGGAGSGTAPVLYDVGTNPDLVGQYVYSVELPFGSFTTTNFPATVQVTTGLDTADGILPNQAYELTAVGGFALGQDALDNPGTVAAPADAPLFGNLSSDTVYPYVMDLLKTASVFEDDGPYTGEMPSGPNFPLTYTLRINIAEGETINNLVIQDLLPDDIAYTGNLSVTFGAGTSGPRNYTVNAEPTINTDDLTGVPAADDTLRITIDSITGQDPNAGASITVTYTAFVPYREESGTLIIDPVGGEENDLDPEYNNASVTGTWNGNAVSDDAGPLPGFDADGLLGDVETDYIIEEHSIAIQKGVGFAAGGDRAVGGTVNPRDVLEYTMNFQISDYFAFTDVVVDDLLGDGQDFLPGDGSNVVDALEIVPTLSFQMDGASVSVNFDPGNFTWVENVDGTTDIQFDVYQQLIDSGFITDGEALRGGFIPDTGILPANLGTFNGGATQGTITYRVQVRESYTSGGQQQISQGDSLTNGVTISGTNRDITTLAALATVTDDSSAGVELPTGTLTKVVESVYSHGNIIPFGDDNNPTTEPVIGVTPGDLVTYRITYTLPLTEFENLQFKDFLPLPIFDVSSIDATQIYDYHATDSFTQSGRISWGPNDTFVGPNGPDQLGDGGIDDNLGYNSTTSIIGSIDKTTFASTNGFVINIGDYHPGDGFDSQTTTLELLVTVPVIDGEFADRLFFTNQVASTEQNTPGTSTETDEIAQIILVQPKLNIKKGITSVTNPSGSFSAPVGPAGVTFNAPGSANAFTGTITSDGLASQAIDANLSNIDAGDTVTFFVVVENTGTSQYGAFDVSISDTIPAGFAIPGGGANLRVSYGDGALLTSGVDYTGDLLSTPLELIDPAANQGALDAYHGTSGQNLIVIAYDLVVQNTVTSLETLTNVAEVQTYAASEGGFDFADPGELQDTATATMSRPAASKVIINTSHDDTNNTDGNREVAIGEVVTYQVTFRIPEGTLNGAQVIDSLPSGMAFVGIDSIIVSPGLSSPSGNLNSDVVGYFNGTARQLELGYATAGVAGLGTIVNSNTDNAVAENIVVTYRAVVLDTTANQIGNNRNNDAELHWTLDTVDQSVQSQISVRVVEPDVRVTKSVVGSVATVEGAQEITYRIRISNNNSNVNVSEAYNVSLSDLLPTDVAYVAASAVWNGIGVAPDASSLQFLPASGPEGEIVATWARLAVGEFSEIEVTVRIDDGLPTDRVIPNTARVEFTSLPDTPGGGAYTGFDPTSANPALTFGTGALNVNLNPANTVYTTAVERTGDPTDPGLAANDYLVSSVVNVTVGNPVGIDKVITDTSEAHTSQDTSTAGTVSGAIGEVVRYEVRIRLPQALNSQLQLVDTLDPGLFWIDAATNDLEIALEGFTVPGNLVASNPLMPPADGTTYALDPALVSYNGTTNQVTFNFGDLTNLETDSTPEYIVIRYNTIVRNDVGNVRGDVLTNSVQLREGGVNLGSPLAVPLTVVEPVLTLTKSDGGVTTADAGDLITYTLNVVASSAANTATAFDLRIADAVPAELEIVGGAVTVVGLPGGSTVVSNTVIGQNIDVRIDQLAPGESFQITFQARVRDTGADQIHSDETVTNTATLAYSSLPDDGTDNGVGDNTTGNESGTPNTESGERLYSTSANDAFTTPSPVLSKVLANPADKNFTIGEEVEYVITLQVPEGRVGSPDAWILDTIDSGFAFVAGSLTVTPSAGITVGTAGLLDESNATFFTHTDPGTASSETMRFDFDFVDFNNTGAANGLNNGTIEIRYRLRVENILTNQETDTLNNTAVFSYTDEDGTTTNVLADSTGDLDTVITIVEPTLTVDKSFSAIQATPDAGDVVSYRIVVDNTSAETAYDVTFIDQTPTGLTFLPGTFTATLNPGQPSQADVSTLFTVTAGGSITAIPGALDIAGGDEVVITYNVSVPATVKDGDLFVNEADIEWTTMDGVVAGERTGDGDPNNPVNPANPNDYEAEDSAQFRADLTYAFTKTIESTSAGHTGILDGTSPTITDLTIGEVVTYRLTATIGRGTTDLVQILDTLDIANGRLDIRNVTVTAGSALSRTDGRAWDADITVTDSLGTDGYDDRLQIDFGTVVNDASGTGAAEQIVILVQAVVVNSLENQDGDVITNTGQLRFLEDIDRDGIQEQQTITDTVDVEIVEPTVTVAKSIPLGTTEADAGDVVGYQIVITNTSDIDAFDLTLRDQLSAAMSLNTGSFIAERSDLFNVASFFTVTAGGITHAGTGFDLAAGQSITITYNATVLSTVTDGQSLLNEVDIEWTSLNAEATDGSDADERGGDGDFDTPATGVDDYEDEDTAEITGELSPLYAFTKVIDSTSAAHTGIINGTNATITDLTIGEVVTYRLTATLGRGTTPLVQIFDTLDIANGRLDIRSVTVTAGSALSRSDARAWDADVSITDALGTDGYNDSVQIDFGTVVNDASGTGADEQIVVLIQAVVVNTIENQDGDVVSNTGTLSFLEDSDNDGNADDTRTITDTVDVEIVEPTVTVAKSIPLGTTEADAGDVVGYQIVITNTSDIDAFDLTLRDQLPAAMSLNTGSFIAERSDLFNVASFFTVSAGGITHAGTGFDLAAGQSITITYNATVLSTVTDGQSLLNEVDIEWTSLNAEATDGSDADERGGDGDFDTPATGVDDYEDEDTAEITGELSPLYDFTKSVFSTSESHTGTAFGTSATITDLVIGETVTYQLTAQLGRGTTPSVIIEDFLALTNGILDIRNVRIETGAAVMVTSSTPVITDSNVDTYDDQVRIDFGSVVNDPTLSGGPEDEQIRIFIDAVVVNVLENQDGDVINNLGRLTVLEDTDNDGNADDSVVRESNVDVEIVEPAISATKSITSIPANPDAGDSVSYEIVIENRSNIDAFDITFQDILPAELDLDTGSFTAIRQSGLSNVASWFAVTTDDINQVGTGFTLAAGDRITITYDATILPTVRDGQDLVNEVDVEWTSISGVNADERGGDGDPDNPAGPLDPNDYEVESSQTFRVDLDPVYAFTKSIESTSATHTGINGGTSATITDLTIGETVVYRLTATIGRGTTDAVQILDTLSIANGRLDIRNVTVTAGAALSRSDSRAWDADVAISDALGADGYNDSVQIDFNTIVNDPSLIINPEDEQIVILIEAVVVNDLENQSGDVVTNTGQLRFLQDIDGDGNQEQQEITDTVDVEIVEPEVTVTKSVITAPANPNAGDIISYQVVIENNSGVDAFEVTFQDLLPADLNLQTATFSATLQPSGFGVDGRFVRTANSITHFGGGFDLADGESITITYDAIILSTVTDGRNLINEADVEWTSLDGTQADERGGDGDFDNPAAVTNPDDYENEDSTTVVANLSPQYGFTKVIGSTSAAHTTAANGTSPTITDLTIGETVTYVLTASIGEGTTPSVQVADILSLANGILDIRAVRITGGSNLTTSVPGGFASVVPTLTDSNVDTYTDQIAIDFGQIVNDASGTNPEDGQIRIEIDAVVVNVVENQDGDVVNNLGRLTVLEDVDNDGEADDEVIREANVDVEIVEPTVTVAKSITTAPANPDAGDTITYEVVIENTSDINAFDLTFRDLLPAELNVDLGSFTATLSTGSVDVSSFFTVTAGQIVQAGSGFDLAAGDRITLTYDTTVLSTVRDGQDLINEADVEWTSLDAEVVDGSDADERGGDGDFDNPAVGVDDYEDES